MMTIEETLKRAPNWDALFRLAESEEGQAISASLDREVWARWLSALDVQENGLTRGDERYQAACRTGRIEWYDARGRKVVLLRMSRAEEEAARRPDGRPHLTWPMLWTEAQRMGGVTLNKRVPADVFAALVEASPLVSEAQCSEAMAEGAWSFRRDEMTVRLSIAPPGGEEAEKASPPSLILTDPGFVPASEVVKAHPELLGSSGDSIGHVDKPPLPPASPVAAPAPVVQVKKGKKK